MTMQSTPGSRVIQMVLMVGAMMSSSVASAHPLHGAGFPGGFAHPFLGLDHLLAMLAVGLWAVQLGGHWRYLLPLGFVSAMCVGGVLAGMAMPDGLTLWLVESLVEPMVAASVLVLGLLIVARSRARAAGVLIAAVFALFHGAAHVAELPSGIALGPYVAGFAAATVMLHAAGVAIGSALSRLGMLRLAGVPFLLAGTWLAMAAV